MIALSLIKNKELKIIEKKIETKLHPLSCRIEILYSGICASDIPRAFDSMAYSYPLIMGHEFVGRIIQVGKSVNRLSVDDIVSAYPLIPEHIHNPKKKKCFHCEDENYNLCNNYSYYGSRTDGSFCQILDVFQWNIHKIQKKINYNICSLIEPTAVAFNIIDKIPRNLSKKAKILLIGSGFIGQILARILKSKFKHLNLVALDRNLFKLKTIKKYSSSQLTFENLNTSEDKKIISSLSEKFDVVIENTGNNKNFVSSVNFAKKSGVVIYAGNPSNDAIFIKKEISTILRKELIIRGVWNSSFKKKLNNWDSAEFFLSKSKNSSIEELITHTSNLENAKDLFQNIHLAKSKRKKFNYIKGLIKIF